VWIGSLSEALTGKIGIVDRREQQGRVVVEVGSLAYASERQHDGARAAAKRPLTPVLLFAIQRPNALHIMSVATPLQVIAKVCG